MEKIKQTWRKFETKNPTFAQFVMFFIVSNGVTLLQLILMPVFRGIFEQTALIDTNFQIWNTGTNLDGTPYYIFDYSAGTINAGGGGGLAYFLAVQITMAIAQVINFFAQRNITFKSNTSKTKAAMWYVIAYIVITIGAAAFQGVYKAPLYNLLMNTWGMGQTGEVLGDLITMFINCNISFFVFFPIFKVIFKRK